MEPKTRTKVRVASLVVLGLVGLCILALDQAAKILVTQNLPLGEKVPVIEDLLVFLYVKNSGAAFSIGSGITWIFSLVGAGVLIFVIWFARRIRSLGWAVMFGLLLGGLLGNLIDRLFREPGFGVGHVVDFISTPWLIPAIYNIADISIVSSMGLFIILTLRGIGIDGTRTPSRKQHAAAAEANRSDVHDESTPDAGVNS